MKETELTLNEKLIHIQSELKATKDKWNKFGSYAYRSAEGILESVKPLLLKYGVSLTISDEIILIGNRFYLKATATIMSGDEKLEKSAYAREEETLKGMSAAQITGATSSYARKYALNGLLCIDDNKDADTDEYHNQQAQTPQHQTTAQPAPQAQVQIPQAVMDAIAKATKNSELAAIWQNNTVLQTIPAFVQAVTARQKQVPNDMETKKKKNETKAA